MMNKRGDESNGREGACRVERNVREGKCGDKMSHGGSRVSEGQLWSRVSAGTR